MKPDVCKQDGLLRRLVPGVALALPASGFFATSANALPSIVTSAAQNAPYGLALAGLATAAIAFLRQRKTNVVLQSAKRRLGEVEHQLNEAESALQAESQILVTWSATALAPERLVGTLHGAISIPTELAQLMNFAAWLEPDSAKRLEDETKILRQNGTPFNFGIRTSESDLLEVDGRAAGTMTTLRFRPLTGQRLETSETSYDAHKLAKQVERLSALLDTAPFPVWLMASSGKLTWINRAYLEAVEAQNFDQVLSENRLLARAESIDQAKADPKQHLKGRARVVRAGKIRALNVHEVANADGVTGYAVDVTDLEEAERELDRYIKAHTSTLDKLPSAIAIFGPDQRLRFHNQAYAQLWQLDEKFLSNHPADGEVLDKLRQLRLLPEQANYREWRTRQLEAYSRIEPKEDFWYLPDGRSLRVVAEQHPFGGVTYLYENLTKELQLESRYNELFEVQRETLDNLAEGLALSGPDGRLRLVNPAFLRFWSLDASFLERKPHVKEMAELSHLSTEARNVWHDIKFGVTALEASRREFEGRINQAGRDIRYRAVPLPDGNALLTFTDISDSVRAERALQERAEAFEAADRLKNSILTNVSYEVRTPLNSIIGFSEALELGIAGKLNAKQLDYVNAIHGSSGDLKAIIDAIIDLSAIDAGQMELKLRQVDVAELLEKSAAKFLPQLEKKSQHLSIEVAADVNKITADPDRLEQILGNLISNAAGFSAEGGKIRLGARKQADTLQIWVSDSGRGIDPEFQRKVFDRFQSKPMAGSHRGPGLGLALVKSFTELHGGKVSLVSKLEQGTTVVCTLPIAGPVKALRAAHLNSAA